MKPLKKREKSVFPYILLGAVVCGFACADSPPERPALVVYVVVDQLRGDLLERYDSVFTGGFRRLLDEGFRFSNATHDHSKTATAPGHATLSTGAFPYRNGIVNNDWMERTADGWRWVYSVQDTMTHILGYPTMPGRSPKNLLRGGLADWIVDADSGAIVVSASRKDRAAITMAGKTQGHVYWIPENEGRFVTSSHYADNYPSWVERFNREEMPRIFSDSIWEESVPVPARSLARRDTADFEGDGIHTFFPHRFSEEVRGGDPARPGALNRWAYDQTHPDAAVGAFAIEAVRSLGLGLDEITDYLGLSFSQVDAVGHDYGPLSREQLDNLVHLDRVLGEVMTFLDRTVGDGRWTMALTGDHGVITIPEYLVELGQEGSRATSDHFRALRNTFQAFRDQAGDPMDVADALVDALEQYPFVGDALTVTELTSGTAADSFVVLMRNSYNPSRWIGGYGSQGSDVVFRFAENYYPSSSLRGTGHGSPYYYDRHVPLIFLGVGVEAGASSESVRTVDIAPTLARLARITAPPDLDGRPLFE